MKITNKIKAAVAVAMLALQSHAQLVPGTNVVATNIDSATLTVVSRDANSRSWGRVQAVATNLQGQVTWRTNTTVTELGAGLHFLKNGQWTESSSAITILPDGSAAASNAAQKAWFPAN